MRGHTTAAVRRDAPHRVTADLPLSGEVDATSASATMRLVAEMQSAPGVDTVPLGSWVDWASLTEGDEKPFQVVMAVPEGKSTRGWYYTRAALEQICAEINARGLPGFLGHQKQDDVDHQFPTPVTHWLGARVHDEGPGTKAVLLVRGLVDRSAVDLKRWVKSGVVKQTSIFGQPTLEVAHGETRVVGYRALSMDWTPLNRAGMPTSVVAMGEMDTVDAAGAAAERRSNSAPHQEGDTVTIADALALLKRELGLKNTTGAVVVGELGIVPADLTAVGEFGTLHEQSDGFKAVAQAFGLQTGKVTDVVKLAETVVAEAIAGRKRAQAETIDRLLGEKVKNEKARPLFKRLLQIDEDADEAKITAAVDGLLADEELKGIAGEMSPGGTGGSSAPVRPADARGGTSGSGGSWGSPAPQQPGTSAGAPAGLVVSSTAI